MFCLCVYVMVFLISVCDMFCLWKLGWIWKYYSDYILRLLMCGISWLWVKLVLCCGCRVVYFIGLLLR